jgi:xanthine dehydrogenase YagS FAD-binding subunit
MCVSPLVSNLAVALAVLDARVIVRRGKETDELTLAQLYATAMRTPTAHNSLRTRDLILQVQIPVVPERRSVYLQVSEKKDFDWALVSCAASARISGLSLSHPQIALGCLAPIPWQVDEAHRFLEGKSLSDEVADHAADIILQGATPLAQNGYKIPIARTLIRRALHQLIG